MDYNFKLQNQDLKVYHNTSLVVSASNIHFFINRCEGVPIGDNVSKTSFHPSYELDWTIGHIGEINQKALTAFGFITDNGIEVPDCSLLIRNDLIAKGYSCLNGVTLQVNQNLKENVVFGRTDKIVSSIEIRPAEDLELEYIINLFDTDPY